MKRIVLLKLDTPLTLIESAQRVPQAEPINFAKALIESVTDMDFEICLFGVSAQQLTIKNSVIKVIPYFGDINHALKNIIDEDTSVIIWQGRQIVQVNTSTNPNETESSVTLLDSWHSEYYEKLSMLKSWQVQMYNLIAKLPEESKKFFILTDCRIPLIELHKIDSVAVPKPLPKDIMLVTQAHLHNAYRKWANKWGNGKAWDEENQGDYVYQFKESTYIPLHCLPLISHTKYTKPLAEKINKPVFQMQSIRHMDDYRKKKLKSAIEHFNGDVVLDGQFNHKDKATVYYEFPEHADLLSKNAIDLQSSFYAGAKNLSNYTKSIVVTDARYARFGLCPNRFVRSSASCVEGKLKSTPTSR
jgi:hypothetical protein